MSKFNTTTRAKQTKTENYAGGQAYQQNPKLEFVSLLLTSFLKDKFYRSEAGELQRLDQLMTSIPDKKFLAQAAVYARDKFAMRSISHVVAAKVADSIKGQDWARRFYSAIVVRPDDIFEIISAYSHGKDGVRFTHAMENGFTYRMNQFDAYQLAKYRGEGKDVSMVDLVNLFHPKPGKKNAKALQMLVEDKLRNTETWESKLTAAGTQAETEEEKEELKSQAWSNLLSENKVGYMALLKNLRNILQQAPDMVDTVAKQLQNREAIVKSRVLPFRFLTAMDELDKLSLDGVNKIKTALSKAIDLSLENVPEFDGRTLIALDVSGSMDGDPAKIGSLFAAMLFKKNGADLMFFSDGARYATDLNPADSVLTIAKTIRFASGGTNFHAIFQNANKKYDRVIILSDMQGWVGYNTPETEFRAYKDTYEADPHIYSVDLNGYGTMEFPENKVYCVAGFSERMFEVMKLLEQDRNALVHEIEKVTF